MSKKWSDCCRVIRGDALLHLQDLGLQNECIAVDEKSEIY